MDDILRGSGSQRVMLLGMVCRPRPLLHRKHTPSLNFSQQNSRTHSLTHSLGSHTHSSLTRSHSACSHFTHLTLYPTMTSVSTPSSNDDILLCQGAEGKVYLSQFCQKKSIVKERLSKSYRVAELDHKINKQRMQQEVRCMVKCRRAGVCTPVVYHVDQAAHRMTLEFIEGVTVKQFLLDTSKPSPDPSSLPPPYSSRRSHL